MKRLALFAAALAVGLTMAVGNAEAARVGGGKSFGMQRQMAPVSKPATTASPQTAAPASAAAKHSSAICVGVTGRCGV